MPTIKPPIGINTLVIAGKVTRDAEMKESQNGKTYARLSISVYQGAKDYVFYEIFAHGLIADRAAELKKDDVIIVIGKLTQYRTDEKTTCQITANNISRLECWGEQIQQPQEPQQTWNYGKHATETQPMSEEDMPF